MPFYEYRCNDCSTQFELRGSFSDKPESTCPKCKGRSRRILSAVPVIFKGSGFYITDSRKKDAKPEQSEPEKAKEVSCS